MKRKIFVVLLAVTLMAAQTLTAFAHCSGEFGGAGSDGTVKWESDDGLTVNQYDSDVLSKLSEDEKAAVEKQIEEANAADLSPIIKTLDKADQNLVKGATVLTNVFDVSGSSSGSITFIVPALNQNVEAVYALHYNIDLRKWEVIKAGLDKETKKVTVTFDSHSPVILVAKTVSSSGGGSKKHKSSGSSSSDSDSTVAAAATVSDEGGVATSPKTGVVSDWTLWMGAAVVLLGISATAFRRTRA